MKDKTTEISHTVFRCLRAKFNEYAKRGELVTPASDAAKILADKGGYETNIAELRKREAYSFAKSAPVSHQRYRRNRFTDSTFSLSVWHPDPEGEWLFVPSDDDRFIGCDAPSGENAWKLQYYASRGEFRRFDQVSAALGEAEILADAEMAE